MFAGREYGSSARRNQVFPQWAYYGSCRWLYLLELVLQRKDENILGESRQDSLSFQR